MKDLLKKENNSGQALLIIIIALSAIVTVVLSVVSRSVIDVRTTSKQEESVRAFSAAEAGVEKALVTGSVGSVITDSGELQSANYSANVTNFAQGQPRFVHPKELISGDSATIWFVSHDPNTNSLVCNPPTSPCFTGNSMRICWGNAGTSGSTATTPAIEVSVLYDPTANGNYSDVAVARATYDPNSSRRGSNSFAAPSAGTCTIDGVTFPFQATVNLGAGGLNIPASAYGSQNGLQLAKLRLLYNTGIAHSVGIDVSATGSNLPGQGRRVVSTGTSGESTRRVEVFTLFSDAPSIFDSVVFSPAGITK